MSRTLTLEISEEMYQTLRQQAEADGTSLERMATVSLERQLAGPTSHQAVSGSQAARERFERHFGEVDLGRPTGVDNESIDADLAREYADDHAEA